MFYLECLWDFFRATYMYCIIMFVLQFPHAVDMHLVFYFDIDLHIACSQGHAQP